MIVKVLKLLNAMSKIYSSLCDSRKAHFLFLNFWAQLKKAKVSH